MKRKTFSAIALCLILCILLSSCSFIDIPGYFRQLGNLFGGGSLTSFENMVYTRPDMEAFQKTLDDSISRVSTEKKIKKLTDTVWEFYDAYNDFFTNYSLAHICYCKDLTDEHWEEEYNFCLENEYTVRAAMDSFYRALAACPLREKLEGDEYFGPDFFEQYDGESVYDEAFEKLLSRESELQSEYYAISGEARGVEYYSEEFFSQYGNRMAEVFVDLVEVRQEIAAEAGYKSYPEFAYDFYHTRDYTCSQATTYLADVRAELVPLYRKVYGTDSLSQLVTYSDEKSTYTYVKDMASAMGGIVDEAFTAMEKGHLYDISCSDKKFDGSFEVYLTGYQTPYVFVSANGTSFDKLTFAHEFGHFCNDYASLGTGVSVDVAETFSQGMEYLSLCYVKDEKIEKLKIAECLSTYVEQAAYASFEQHVYSLTGEDLTTEKVQELYETICTGYGFDCRNWDSRDYVCISHFFTSPMYVISYVVSNDAAFQMYQMEIAEKGKGLTCLQNNLNTERAYFLDFLGSAGLDSPFAPGRLNDVKNTLQTILG